MKNHANWSPGKVKDHGSRRPLRPAQEVENPENRLDDLLPDQEEHLEDEIEQPDRPDDGDHRGKTGQEDAEPLPDHGVLDRPGGPDIALFHLRPGTNALPARLATFHLLRSGDLCLGWMVMRLLLPILLLPSLLAAQTRVLVIGDSLSAEYEYETPFSAPDSDPFDANTVNWVEILAVQRGSGLDFGDEDTHADLRLAGYKYNWGVPSADTEFWEDVFQASISSDFSLWLSQMTLLEQLSAVDVAVVVLGGNDVNSEYGNLYDDTPPAGFAAGVLDRLEFILQSLRDERADLPLVLVSIPDVGVTPDVQFDHPDPAKRATASAHIAALNVGVAGLAASFNAELVDFQALLAPFLAPEPYHLGPQLMVKSFHPENPPTYLFCKDGFHPASTIHALLGNAIVEALNAKLGTTVTPLPNREILAEVLGLNPDQAFLDWIASFPGATPDGLADDDFDGLVTLGEYALGLHPLLPDAPELLAGGPPRLQFTPDPQAARYVQTIPEEAPDVQSWTPVPPRADHHPPRRIHRGGTPARTGRIRQAPLPPPALRMSRRAPRKIPWTTTP